MRGEARSEKTEGGVISTSSPRMMPKLILLPILVALIAASSARGDAPERLLWKFQSLSWYNRFSTNSTVGPIVLGPTAIFGGTYSYQNTTESKLAMVDLASGQARWRFERVGPIGPMAVYGSAIAVGNGDAVLLLDLATGRLRWEAKGSAQTLAIAGEVVLATESGSLLAREPGQGKARWRASLSSRAPMAPALLPSLVLAGASAERESLIAFNRATGAPVWKARVGTVSVQPVLKGETLYVAGQGPKRLYALGVATGTPLWSVMLNGWPLGAVLTADGKLLVSTDDLTLYAFRTE